MPVFLLSYPAQPGTRTGEGRATPAYCSFPQHFLYFFPLPQEHGALPAGFGLYAAGQGQFAVFIPFSALISAIESGIFENTVIRFVRIVNRKHSFLWHTVLKTRPPLHFRNDVINKAVIPIFSY